MWWRSRAHLIHERFFLCLLLLCAIAMTPNWVNRIEQNISCNKFYLPFACEPYEWIVCNKSKMRLSESKTPETTIARMENWQPKFSLSIHIDTGLDLNRKSVTRHCNTHITHTIKPKYEICQFYKVNERERERRSGKRIKCATKCLNRKVLLANTECCFKSALFASIFQSFKLFSISFFLSPS